jgi:hypothetical protein
MQRPIVSGLASRSKPSSASASAEPDFDDSDRLPCLATVAPAPDAIKAAQVETL